MVRSCITSTVKAVRLCKIVSRLLGRLGSRCCASTMGAGKSVDKVLTKIERASIPPAEEPTTTRSPLLDVTFSRSLIRYLPLLLQSARSYNRCRQVRDFVKICCTERLLRQA